MGPVRTSRASRRIVPVRPRTEATVPALPRRAIERLVAALLLLIGLPVMVGVALVVWVSDGRAIFYRGTRLGAHRRRFDILKFRTLRRNAQQVVGGRLVSDSDNLAIRGGKILRACRLDELPQLINIVRGDMSFWGPRPERPEVYESQCRAVDGYDRRFSVRPGLVGVSQLFTPHKTSKRFRTRLDNEMLETPPSVGRQVRLIVFTVLCTARTFLGSLWKSLSQSLRCSKLFGRGGQRRRLKRVRPHSATLRIDGGDTPESEAAQPVADLVDIDERFLRVRSHHDLPTEQTADVELEIPIRRNGRVRSRRARCIVSFHARRGDEKSPEYVFQYEPRDGYSEYVVHQYFLRNSLATPARFPRQHAG